MSEWEIQLILEATKILIFCGQLILLFLVVDRLRRVADGLEEVRSALKDLDRRLRRGKITDEGD
jgi:hypothetical protein